MYEIAVVCLFVNMYGIYNDATKRRWVWFAMSTIGLIGSIVWLALIIYHRPA